MVACRTLEVMGSNPALVPCVLEQDALTPFIMDETAYSIGETPHSIGETPHSIGEILASFRLH